MSKPSLIHNILALSSVQLISYLLPLVTVPYLTRVLGVEAWGTVSLVNIVIGYFTLVTNWGFNLSATRKISTNRNDLEKLSQIFISTWFAQWVLCILVCLILYLAIYFVTPLKSISTYYLWGSSLIIGNVLFPVWFFNGVERMKELATLQIFTRLLAIPLVFTLIKSPNDAPFMLAISGVTGILSGFISIFWIKKNLDLCWKLPSAGQVYLEFHEGAGVFLSTIWISCYTSITPIILGSIEGVNAVGYYTFADRFRSLAQSILNPISQAIFPRLSNLFSKSTEEAKKLIIKSSIVIIITSVSSTILLWLFAPYIVLMMGGESFRPAITILRWLSPLPFIVSISNILGLQVLLPTQKTSIFNRILAVCGVISLLMIVPLIHWNGYIGAPVNTLITESMVSILMGVYVWKSKIFINSTKLRKTNEV